MRKTLLSLSLILTGFFAIGQEASIEWLETYGGTNYDTGFSVVQTSDNGFMFVGVTESEDGDIDISLGGEDLWLVKTDHKGKLEWEKTYGGSDYDRGFKIIQTQDNNYMIAGTTWSNDGDVSNNKGGSDFWVLKVDEEGELLWEKTYGGSSDESATTLIETIDGNYIIAGSTWSSDGDISANHGGGDIWIIKIDENGELIWENNFGGTDQDWVSSVKQTNDRGYVLAGTTRSRNGDVSSPIMWDDIWILKLDEAGDLEWEKTFGGTDFEVANDIHQDLDGNYMVVGYTWSDDGDVSNLKGEKNIWILKLAADGDLLWEKTYGGSQHEQPKAMQQTKDGGYIIAGSSSSNDGDLTENNGKVDIWVFKIDNEGELEWQKSIGGDGQDEANHIIEIDNGTYIVAGYTESEDGDINLNQGKTDFLLAQITSPTMGVVNIQQTPVLKFYPNPTDSYIIMDINADEIIKEISVTDILGRKQNVNIKSKQLNVAHLTPGIYFLNVTTENGSFSNKIIKK